MKRSEIMTLLGAGVDEKIVSTAILAGKLDTVIRAVALDIERAKHFRENADWSNLITILEGKLEEELDRAAFTEKERRRKTREETTY